jgi:iron complex transport system ATP-binding protein
MSVALTNLSVKRGPRLAVVDVTLNFDRGQFVAVVGPNGSGKTTLLATIAGDIQPSSGTVEVDGRPIHGASPAEAAQIRSFLGQEHRSIAGFDVATVVGFGAFVSDGISEPEERIRRAMNRTGVTDIADRRHDELSGGEQRRVAIARVLCQSAPLMLLDEPTDSLDLGHANSVMSIARDEADAGNTVITTSHDLNIAARYATVMVLLDRGRVAAVGSPADVLQAERVSAVYQTPVRVIPHPDSGTPMVIST